MLRPRILRPVVIVMSQVPSITRKYRTVTPGAVDRATAQAPSPSFPDLPVVSTVTVGTLATTQRHCCHSGRLGGVFRDWRGVSGVVCKKTGSSDQPDNDDGDEDDDQPGD